MVMRSKGGVERLLSSHVCCLKSGTGEDCYERQIRTGILYKPKIGTKERSDKKKPERKVIFNVTSQDVG
jgi:hypothetical protein